jgi:hypothetical protein
METLKWVQKRSSDMEIKTPKVYYETLKFIKTKVRIYEFIGISFPILISFYVGP